MSKSSSYSTKQTTRVMRAALFANKLQLLFWSIQKVTNIWIQKKIINNFDIKKKKQTNNINMLMEFHTCVGKLVLINVIKQYKSSKNNLLCTYMDLKRIMDWLLSYGAIVSCVQLWGGGRWLMDLLLIYQVLYQLHATEGVGGQKR
eukprot:164309_1